MKAHLKALRWVLLPTIFVYIILSAVMLDFKTPLDWLLMTNSIGIIFRIVLLAFEIIFYLVLVSYYKRDHKPDSFWEWLKD